MALIASWSTLFCGTLLYDESVSVAVRGIVTAAIVLVRPCLDCRTSVELHAARKRRTESSRLPGAVLHHVDSRLPYAIVHAHNL